MLGHLALVIAFYEKCQLAGGIRRRNGGIWADDGFAFVVQKCLVRRLHEEK